MLVPSLLAELDVTLSRQGSRAERLGSGGEAVALPFDLTASEVRSELVARVSVFYRLARMSLAEDQRELERPRAQALVLAGWPGLAAWHMARAMSVTVVSAVEQAEIVIDRPSTTVFVGWCAHKLADGWVCGRALYVPQGELMAKCPKCGRAWDVAKSRASLLLDAHDALAPASTLAAALGIASSTLRSWKHRGKLSQATDSDGKLMYSPEGRPLYRVSDVRALTGEGNAPS